MIKQSLTTLLLAASLLTANAFAMQLNVKLADEMIANKNELDIAADIYYVKLSSGTGEIKEELLHLNGIAAEKFSHTIDIINSVFAEMNPTDSIDGKHSQITLGYKKQDGTIITPASCQSILARPMMDIEFSESGCIVK